MYVVKESNEDFYNYIDDLKSFGNSYDRCIESAIYCIENKCIPKEVV
ncbi:MAG: hypothetical protein LIO71_07365 [Ruminococcus sp.]|nr:hypothetical protein [Ruminococcus sp.]